MASRSLAMLGIVTAALLAANAQALYIETPLKLVPSRSEGNVGDPIDFEIGASNETSRETYAGRLVHLRYSFDLDEGTDRSAQSETAPRTRTGDVGSFTLDEKAQATFRWTIPAELDDRNVVLFLHSEEGDLLATADLRVGDAPQVYRIAAGTPEPQEGELDDDARKDAPAAGVVAALGAVAALAVARRR